MHHFLFFLFEIETMGDRNFLACCWLAYHLRQSKLHENMARRRMVARGVIVRGYLSGGNCPGGNCPGGNCPDTLPPYLMNATDDSLNKS